MFRFTGVRNESRDTTASYSTLIMVSESPSTAADGLVRSDICKIRRASSKSKSLDLTLYESISKRIWKCCGIRRPESNASSWIRVCCRGSETSMPTKYFSMLAFTHAEQSPPWTIDKQDCCSTRYEES